MALKDKFEKIVSYFDTDDANGVEETDGFEEQESQEVRTPRPARQPQSQQPNPRQEQASTGQPTRPQADPKATSSSWPSQERERERQVASVKTNRQAQEEKIRTMPSRTSEAQAPTSAGGTTIALKFPRKYEDAQEIVDLLIDNECVLIDFQYMLEAQARRCLDFIDGASRVLAGNLQKVGSSMYLLTPRDVVVNMEEMNLSNGSQDVSFDYDMKRR